MTFFKLLMFYLNKIILFFTILFSTNSQNSILKIDKNKEYIEKKINKLQNFLKNPEKINKNMKSNYYNIEEFSNDMDIENEWKRKIAIIYTPLGNIFMYYNVYKLAFSYYSDQNIPFPLLNAAAIDYVINYNCLDFLADEENLNNYNNIFLNNLKNFHDSSNGKTKKKFLENDVFVKSKSKNEKKQEEEEKKEGKEEENEKNYFKNKFINCGKFSTIDIFKKKKAPPFQVNSELLNSLNTQSNIISYKDYKNKNNL